MTIDELTTIVMGELGYVNMWLIILGIGCVILAIVAWKMWYTLKQHDYVIFMMDEEIKELKKEMRRY